MIAATPYFASSYFAPSYFGPLGAIPADPPSPLLFKHELAAWLKANLGVDVHAWGRPQDEPDKVGVLTYAVVDGDTPPLLAGPGGYNWATIQFDAWASTPDAAELVQARLYAALFGRHQIGRANNVQAIRRTHRTSAEPPVGGGSRWTYRDSYDWWLRWDDPGAA